MTGAGARIFCPDAVAFCKGTRCALWEFVWLGRSVPVYPLSLPHSRAAADTKAWKRSGKGSRDNGRHMSARRAGPALCRPGGLTARTPAGSCDGVPDVPPASVGWREGWTGMLGLVRMLDARISQDTMLVERGIGIWPSIPTASCWHFANFVRRWHPPGRIHPTPFKFALTEKWSCDSVRNVSPRALAIIIIPWPSPADVRDGRSCEDRSSRAGRSRRRPSPGGVRGVSSSCHTTSSRLLEPQIGGKAGPYVVDKECCNWGQRSLKDPALERSLNPLHGLTTPYRIWI